MIELKIDYQPRVYISWGDFFDKKSILEIKLQKISSESARKNIDLELSVLNQELNKLNSTQNIENLVVELYEVNLQLWSIEDDIRAKESEQIFDNEFIELSRMIYIKNDTRAKIKKQINNILKSEIVEEKQYKQY